MGILSLGDQAQLIHQQRLKAAAEARTKKRVIARHRTQRRLARAIALGVREGLTADGIGDEWIRIIRYRSIAQAK